MKVYFRFLGSGELPAINIGKNYALTVENGVPRNARKHYEATKVYAAENDYPEQHGWWSQHFLDLADEIEHWCDSPDIATLREEIRIPLMRDARSMRTRDVVIFIRCYYAAEGPHGNHLINFTAGMIGFDNIVVLASPMVFGPSREFKSEEFADRVIDGQQIPEGMNRYGITPRGKIINPFPPTCGHCGHRHYGPNHGRMSFGEWAEKVENGA